MEKLGSQPLDSLETEIEKYPVKALSLSHKKEGSSSKNNGTKRKHNFPRINSRNQSESYNLKQENKKMLVSSLVKEIIEEYASQQKYQVEDPNFRKKPRAITQAISRSYPFKID